MLWRKPRKNRELRYTKKAKGGKWLRESGGEKPITTVIDWKDNQLSGDATNKYEWTPVMINGDDDCFIC